MKNTVHFSATVTDKPRANTMFLTIQREFRVWREQRRSRDKSRCPYCQMKDPRPETHLAEDRCHPPKRWSEPRGTKRWDEA